MTKTKRARLNAIMDAWQREFDASHAALMRATGLYADDIGDGARSRSESWPFNLAAYLPSASGPEVGVWMDIDRKLGRQ